MWQQQQQEQEQGHGKESISCRGGRGAAASKEPAASKCCSMQYVVVNILLGGKIIHVLIKRPSNSRSTGAGHCRHGHEGASSGLGWLAYYVGFLVFFLTNGLGTNGAVSMPVHAGLKDFL